MADQALPVAVIGIGGIGEKTLQALTGLEGVRVVGVADRDAQALARLGDQAGAPAYTDNRRLLAEAKPRVASRRAGTSLCK